VPTTTFIHVIVAFKKIFILAAVSNSLFVGKSKEMAEDSVKGETSFSTRSPPFFYTSRSNSGRPVGLLRPGIIDPYYFQTPARIYGEKARKRNVRSC
jgi:hypothetical protein